MIRMGARMLFQFHTGSIKAKLANHFKISLDFCFNSTLVRLKQYFRLYQLRIFYMFQFHTGSIKAIKPGHRQPAFQIRFNSTLVRLKLERIKGVSQCRYCFNSTLVRLKQRPEFVLDEHLEYCFNSTLVRLKLLF